MWCHRAKHISLSAFLSIRLCRDCRWWDWRIVVDSVDTRVLWSERAVGIQVYGTEEEHRQTFQQQRTVHVQIAANIEHELHFQREATRIENLQHFLDRRDTSIRENTGEPVDTTKKQNIKPGIRAREREL